MAIARFGFNRSISKKLKSLLALGTLGGFLVTNIVPACAQSVLTLPKPGIRVSAGAAITPILLKAVKVHPDNPFLFDFVVDSGDSNLTDEQLQRESTRLIKYFLAAITTPEDDLWVNLSPYEKDRIIAGSFGKTEMGRDLLAQDYILKQLTASLLYPEEELGKEFWTKVYEEAKTKFGTTDIPVNTFNKVWIVPEKAVVYENDVTAYVGETRLKVLLEQDYLALAHALPGSKSLGPNDSSGTAPATPSSDPKVNALGEQIIREIIIPAIEKEVNTGSNFVRVRQAFHSLILANWYKKRLKDSILAAGYMNKNKVLGVDVTDKAETQKIYDLYVEAFKKGVYNYIKEDIDPQTQEIVPRKYFSGGMLWKDTNTVYRPLAPGAVPASLTPQFDITVNMDFTREGHDSFNVGIAAVLKDIAQELNVETIDGEYAFPEFLNRQAGQKADLPGGGQIRLQDGVLVIIDSRFSGMDHAGRDRNVVYASSEAKAEHELTELALLKDFVQQQGIDISNGLGTGLRQWSNDKTIGTDALLKRQNTLRQLAFDLHRAGLKAEGRNDEISGENAESATAVVDDFDWQILGQVARSQSLPQKIQYKLLLAQEERNQRAQLYWKVHDIQEQKIAIDEETVQEISKLLKIPIAKQFKVPMDHDAFWEWFLQIETNPYLGNDELKKWLELWSEAVEEKVFKQLSERREKNWNIDQYTILRSAKLLGVSRPKMPLNNKEIFWKWLREVLIYATQESVIMKPEVLKAWKRYFINRVSVLNEDTFKLPYFFEALRSVASIPNPKEKAFDELVEELADRFFYPKIEISFLLINRRMKDTTFDGYDASMFKDWLEKTLSSAESIKLSKILALSKLSESYHLPVVIPLGKTQEQIESIITNAYKEVNYYLSGKIENLDFTTPVNLPRIERRSAVPLEKVPAQEKQAVNIRPEAARVDLNISPEINEVIKKEPVRADVKISPEFNIPPEINKVLEKIAGELHVSNVGTWEESLRQYMDEKSGPVKLSENGEIRSIEYPNGIKVLVIVHPGIKKTDKYDNPGRDRNVIYAADEPQAAYEITVLRKLTSFAQLQGIDATNGLISGLNNWAKEKGIKEQTKLDRTERLNGLFVRSHEEGVNEEMKVRDRSKPMADIEQDILQEIAKSKKAREAGESAAPDSLTPQPAEPEPVSTPQDVFSRREHDRKLNLRVGLVLNKIAGQLGIEENVDGEYPFNDFIEKQPGQRMDLSPGEMYLHTDAFGEKVLVIIHPDFKGFDHAGRNRNAVYTETKSKAAHEIKELELLKGFAVGQGINTKNGLGWGIRDWANDKSISKEELLDRQNQLRQLAYDAHEQGQKAEAEESGESYEIIPKDIEKAKTIVEDFDWAIAGNSQENPDEDRIPGGINFNSDNWNLDIRSDTPFVNFKIDPEKFKNIEFDGLEPVIIQIIPITNVSLFLQASHAPVKQSASL